MFNIDAMSRTPVYEQIVLQVERLCRLGVLKAGDQLPSVRALSLTLSVNPNTIQKAYSELDARGLATSVHGKGCFISRASEDALESAKEKKLSELTETVKSLKADGLTADEILRAVEKALDKN
jgi:GntR family transcriptional regulator